MTRCIFLSISIIFLFATRLRFLYISHTARLVSGSFTYHTPPYSSPASFWALENMYAPLRPHLGLKQYFFTFTPITTQKAWVFNHLNFFIRPKTIHFPLQNNLLTFFLGVNIQVVHLTPKSSQVNLLEWQNLCYISK